MATTSSMPAPMACPVKPLVLVMTTRSASAPKTRRSALISAAALPPRAGVYVSCETNIVEGAIACRDTPRPSASRTRDSMTPPMCSTSSLVPWKALLAVTAPSTSQMGWMPRSRAASADSTTSAAAPTPTIIPCRRRSNGVAASSTRSSVAAAPVARNPEVTQGSRCSPVASSAETMTTRLHRPARIQSSATESACVVLAQAALTWVFGPRAPMISANWLCPIDRTRNRNFRSNAYGSAARVARSSAMSRSASAAAGSSPDIAARTASRARRLSRRPLSTAYASTASANRSYPGKAEAKMTPVSSRSDSGSPQRSGSWVPSVVVL